MGRRSNFDRSYAFVEVHTCPHCGGNVTVYPTCHACQETRIVADGYDMERVMAYAWGKYGCPCAVCRAWRGKRPLGAKDLTKIAM